tara:strand:- start:2943 stop:5348 length:2406 start_codon:yes stop_codon:yes gene_type:complete
LLANSPKEAEMLRQALRQSWPNAHFHTDFEAPQDKSAMVICWDSAFKKVPPQMLQERPTVAVFESNDAPARIDALKQGLAQIVLPSESRTAYLCQACQFMLSKFQEQKQQKQKWDKVVKSSTDAIYLITNGVLVDVNPRFESLFGYTRKEALATDFSILKHVVASESRAFIEDRLQRIKRDQKVDTQYEFVASRKDGSTFLAHVSIRYVDDKEGKSALGIVKNITEQKEYENKLLQQNIELNRLADRQKKTVRQLLAVDEVAKTIAVTRSEYDVVEHIAQQIRKLFSPDRLLIGFFNANSNEIRLPFALKGQHPKRDHDPVKRDHTLMGTAMELQRVLQRHMPTSASLPAPPLPELEKSWASEGMQSLIAIPILKRRAPVGGILLGFEKHTPLDDDDAEALMSISNHLALGLTNVEMHQAKEKADQLLNDLQNRSGRAAHLITLGEMAAGVAHDLNNLFAAILGRTTLLRRAKDEESATEHIDIIDKAVDDGARTLKRLQQFSDDDLEQNREDLAPAILLEDAIAITRPKWSRLMDQQKSEGIQVQLEADLPGDIQIFVVPHEIREVLINLIHNAVDAMSDGGSLSLKAFLDPARPQHVCLEIRDTGPGIPPKNLNKIFERFFTTKGVHGTGLGLAVSKEIVEKNEGHIQVSSHTEGADKGTIFSLYLPMSLKQSKNAHPSESAPRTILIVDDEPNVREILEDLLSAEGHRALSCESGEEALEVLAKQEIDLVFTDLTLPKMDGYTLASQIKSQQPQMPVCIITGWDNPLILKEDPATHVDRVVNKPFRMEEVMRAVSDLT